MKALLIIIAVLFSVESFSQQNKLQQEIDEQVWKPFITYFSNYQTKEFLNLHDADVVRVGIDRSRIYGLNMYEAMQRRGDSASVANGQKRTIEFKFYNRIANATDAFEIGLYKGVSTNKEGKESVYYGKFWVLLKKVDGVWKIKLDADTNEGITKEVYDSLVSK